MHATTGRSAGEAGPSPACPGGRRVPHRRLLVKVTASTAPPRRAAVRPATSASAGAHGAWRSHSSTRAPRAPSASGSTARLPPPAAGHAAVAKVLAGERVDQARRGTRRPPPGRAGGGARAGPRSRGRSPPAARTRLAHVAPRGAKRPKRHAVHAVNTIQSCTRGRGAHERPGIVGGAIAMVGAGSPPPHRPPAARPARPPARAGVSPPHGARAGAPGPRWLTGSTTLPTTMIAGASSQTARRACPFMWRPPSPRTRRPAPDGGRRRLRRHAVRDQRPSGWRHLPHAHQEHGGAWRASAAQERRGTPRAGPRLVAVAR
jgi:hypothetical protein